MVELVRVDAVPIQVEQFSQFFERWLTALVDSVNETIQVIEDNLNTITGYVSDDGLSIPHKTTAEITTLATTMPNGTFWYDTTTNEIKAKRNGVVVVVV